VQDATAVTTNWSSSWKLWGSHCGVSGGSRLPGCATIRLSYRNTLESSLDISRALQVLPEYIVACYICVLVRHWTVSSTYGTVYH